MSFYSQTLDDIPKEFLFHQKSKVKNTLPEMGLTTKTEDLLFILSVLLLLLDEPYFSELDSVQ